MGREFTYQGRRVYALRADEAQAARNSISLISAWFHAVEPAERLPYAECQDYLAQLFTTSSRFSLHSYFLEQGDGGRLPNNNLEQLPCEIPPADDVVWARDPELNAILTYAPAGLLISPSDVSTMNSLITGASSIANGRCAWRSKWRLVGATALLGAGLLGTGLYIYSRRTKRRK